MAQQHDTPGEDYASRVQPMTTDIRRPHEDSSREPTPERPPALAARSPERRLCAPPIDIFESDEGLVMRADLPGVTSDGLELQVQDNKLTLFGRVTADIPTGGSLLHQEYDVCDFLRSFILSEGVDHDRIQAKLSGGVLEVLLPHADRPQPRRIPVSTE